MKRDAKRPTVDEGKPADQYPTGGCHAGLDGECNWLSCPQIQDGEPKKSGRHCPRDTRSEDDE